VWSVHVWFSIGGCWQKVTGYMSLAKARKAAGQYDDARGIRLVNAEGGIIEIRGSFPRE
jgi:hypothetical protein